MTMGILSHDEFFAQLGELFSSRKNKDHGAIHLSQKRFTHDQEAASSSDEHPLADLNPETPLPLLIRATNGKSKDDRAKKLKLSTLVEPDALDVFYARYAEVCKGGMTALKPRDRTKRKGKAKKRKVGGAGTTSMTAIQ